MTLTVEQKLASFPDAVKARVEQIKALIFSVAKEQQLGPVVESIKWGELSYTTKTGSPIRMDWKQASQQQISVYFNCNTILVETFREIYGDSLTLVGKRELVLCLAQPLPEVQLRACFAMALNYHKLKTLPLLGA